MLRRTFVCAALLVLFSCNNSEETGVKKEAATGTPAGNLPQTQAEPPSPPDENLSLQQLEERHALVPSDPGLAYELAYAYAEQKNPKALRLADSLIKAKAPEAEKAYFTKAYYFSQTGNTKDAVKAYDEAIAANYNFMDAHLEKGRLLFHQKQYEAALKAFATGQKISPKEAMFYYWVGKTQEAMGDKGNAKDNYERAFALDKSLTEAKEAAKGL